MFRVLIDAICDRIRAAVFARMSEECHAADGCGALQVDVAARSLPAPTPEKKTARK